MNEEEKQYAELNAKFHAELADIKDQMKALEERYNELHSLLFGVPDPILVEEDGDPVKGPVVEDQPKIDKALVRFIKANPGAKREHIDEYFEGWNLTTKQIARSRDRCRRRGLIISEGKSKGTQWYPTEHA